MKPNGRRRWRQWSARSRQRYRRTAKRDGYKLHPDELKMHKGVHLKERKVCGILPPLPAREFSPRSLVGMTQGARKRAVWREFDAVSCPPGVESTADRMQWYLLRMPYLRGKYRLGERLRPCPGCAECQRCAVCGQPSTCVGLYDPIHVHQKPEPACDDCCGHGCEDGHCDKRDPDDEHCDGSGVLPARGRQ